MSQSPLPSSHAVAASHQNQDHSVDQNTQSESRSDTTTRLHDMEQALPDSNPEMQSTECIAIGDYWPGHCDITAEEIEEFLHGAQGPLPTEDDFADEPPPTSFNPENGIYEWARADAWVEEKDSKGRTVWRNRILGTTENSRPAVLDPKIQMTDKQDKEGLSCPLEQSKEK